MTKMTMILQLDVILIESWFSTNFLNRDPLKLVIPIGMADFLLADTDLNWRSRFKFGPMRSAPPGADAAGRIGVQRSARDDGVRAEDIRRVTANG